MEGRSDKGAIRQEKQQGCPLDAFDGVDEGVVKGPGGARKEEDEGSGRGRGHRKKMKNDEVSG